MILDLWRGRGHLKKEWAHVRRGRREGGMEEEVTGGGEDKKWGNFVPTGRGRGRGRPPAHVIRCVFVNFLSRGKKQETLHSTAGDDLTPLWANQKRAETLLVGSEPAVLPSE